MKTLLGIYLGSAVLAVIFTPAVIFAGRRFGVVDKPSARKVHLKPIARIGGTAFVMAMMVSLILAIVLSASVRNAFVGIREQALTLLIASVCIFLVGLVDDIRGLSSKIKFLALSGASLAICASGARISSVSIGDWFTLEMGWMGWPVTVLWIVGVTVGINFIDGLDGLAAGISAIVCGVICVVGLHFGQFMTAVFMLALLGGLSGFLLFNFNPARIFMGDCGSMFLGFTLGAGTIMCASKTSSITAYALPAVALGVPIIDSMCTMIRRGIIERRSIFNAERGHIHHRLLDLGLHQRHVVIVLYAVTLAATALGSFMLVTDGAGDIVVSLCIFVLLAMLFRVTGSVQLHQIITAIRYNWAIKEETKKYKNHFEDMQLEARVVSSFDEWWRTVCMTAEKMGFIGLRLCLTNRDGSKRTLRWVGKQEDVEAEDLVKMTVPIRDRRKGPPLRLENEIYANGSLESAGRRVTLFVRLIEEYSIANLPGKGRRKPVSKFATV